ncbi:hypothetical protein [Pseudoduganella sp. HUAS MS19]
MSAVLMVEGFVFVEESSRGRSPLVQAKPNESERPMPTARQEFLARMDNWRKVVYGKVSAGANSQYCASWARAYVQRRVAEEPPESDVIEARVRPLSPLVPADMLDGWLVEAAWRSMGCYNERQALKALYIQRWPADQIRRFLRGVRGSHVPLVIAKAERNLQSILNKLDDTVIIPSTTCLPGRPEPSAETASP